MDLYYKIEKGSDTGMKFAELESRGTQCVLKSLEVVEKYGFTQYRPSTWGIYGGISSFVSPEKNPDSKVWKKDRNGEYFPNKRSKEGRQIFDEISELPIVERKELNAIVGYDDPFSHIGFYMSNKKYFGVILMDNWKVIPPSDCIEITGSEFKLLFELKKCK